MRSAHNATILVIDDDALFVGWITEALQADRYGVETVGRGDDALGLLAQRHLNLIMMSIMLPDIRGIDLCRLVRRSVRRVPIIFLAGHHASDDLTAGLEAGADDYITKSCPTEELLARVRAALRRCDGAALMPHG